jgi:hypothetical protein
MPLRKRLANWTFAALCWALLASLARATPINGLPPSSGINATDTIPVCQLASGCGASNPLNAMRLSSVLGTVANSITEATTLGNGSNNQITPVSGSGYAITLPQSTSSTLPTGSKVILAAAAGANVDICVASGSAFDTGSAAPLTPALCSGGTTGIILAGGETLTINSESGGNYFAAMAGNAGGLEAPRTGNYTVSAATDIGETIPLNCGTSTVCTITLPVASSFPAGQWVIIIDEANDNTRGDLIAATSPSTIYGVPVTLCCGELIPIEPGMGVKAISDGTNWFVMQWGTLPGQDTVTGTTYTPDVWDCYQLHHFTSASAVTVTIPTGLPAGCNMMFSQDGAGQVEVVAGSGFTLHAYSNDAHSAGQYAQFFVNIWAGGTAGVLGGNIAP